MEYIIWGVGVRGKRAFELLGEEQVVAFVDTDTSKIGQMYEGVEICSIEKAEHLYKEAMYVITPRGHETAIEQILQERGIERYIRLGNMGLLAAADNFFSDYQWDISKDRCAIYGITLFNILLYKYLEKNVVEEMYLISQEDIAEKVLRMIMVECRLINKKEISKDMKVIVSTNDEKQNFNGCDNIETLTSILNRGLPIYNEKLIKFKDIYKGKRCFIIATGPSLMVEDLNALKEHGEITISMNRIYNIFSRTLWRPDCYVVTDREAIEDLSDEIAELPILYKFVPNRPESYWDSPSSNTSFKFRLISESYTKESPKFSTDISRGVFEGYTVTYACLQIAIYMGFDEIYLLGVDFNYSADIYSDNNHFEGYRNENRNVRLNEVNLEYVGLSYEKAKQYGDEHGVKIYNATRGGKLEVFPRVEFDKLFQ